MATPLGGGDHLGPRTGFPCFDAPLAGHAEATISSDADMNRLRPLALLRHPDDWLAMQAIGARAGVAIASDSYVKAAWDAAALNPARTPPELAESAAMQQVLGRLRVNAGPAPTRMAELASIS